MSVPTLTRTWKEGVRQDGTFPIERVTILVVSSVKKNTRLKFPSLSPQPPTYFIPFT